MVKQIKFFKENEKWYADIPNHTKEENEMVMGSDVALDFLSEGKNEVIIEVSDENTGNYIGHYVMIEHEDDGAYYQKQGRYDELDQIWICNVTHDVFGEHPNNLYILKVIL